MNEYLSWASKYMYFLHTCITHINAVTTFGPGICITESFITMYKYIHTHINIAY